MTRTKPILEWHEIRNCQLMNGTQDLSGEIQLLAPLYSNLLIRLIMVLIGVINIIIVIIITDFRSRIGRRDADQLVGRSAGVLGTRQAVGHRYTGRDDDVVCLARFRVDSDRARE